MMKRLTILVLAFMLISAVAVAQNGNGQRQRMNPVEMLDRMAERLAQQMKLEGEKADAFKILYVDYQMARQNAANPKGERQDANVDADKLTDEQAKALIEKRLAAQEAQLKVDREYLAKFLEIITPSQAVLIYERRMSGGMMRGNGRGNRRND